MSDRASPSPQPGQLFAEGAQRLRQAFTTPRAFSWQGELPVRQAQARAAVLIPILMHASGPSVLLTRRTDHLYHHPGQISLPGGRAEEGDASLSDAALRETEEEIGIARSRVEVLGVLPMYATSSGFQVQPVVGLIDGPAQCQPDAFEVAEIFEVPLAFVLDQGNYQRHRFERPGQSGHFFAVPYQGRFIWGATAGMLAMFAAYMQSA